MLLALLRCYTSIFDGFIISKVVYYIQSLSARCKCSNSIGQECWEGRIWGTVSADPVRKLLHLKASPPSSLHPDGGAVVAVREERGKIGSKLQNHSSSDVMKQDRSRRNIRKSEVSRSTAKYSLASSRFEREPLKASFDGIVSLPPDFLFDSHHTKV